MQLFFLKLIYSRIKKQAWLNHLGRICTNLSVPLVAPFLFFAQAKKKSSGLFWNHPRFVGEDERVHFESMAKEHEEQKANLEVPIFECKVDVENSRRARLGESWGDVFTTVSRVRLEVKPKNRIHPQNIGLGGRFQRVLCPEQLAKMLVKLRTESFVQNGCSTTKNSRYPNYIDLPRP